MKNLFVVSLVGLLLSGCALSQRTARLDHILFQIRDEVKKDNELDTHKEELGPKYKKEKEAIQSRLRKLENEFKAEQEKEL